MEEERIYKLYMHTNLINGKKYIGITSLLPNERWKSGSGYRKSTHFGDAIKKYGWKNFKHEVIFVNLTLTEANILEKYSIEALNLTNPKYGYNHKEGGANGKHSEETKKKLSESHKGSKNHMYGKHHTEATKIKIGNKNRGRVRTQETTNKIVKKILGQKRSNETKIKMSKNNYWKGKKIPQEIRRKISESKKGSTPWNKGLKDCYSQDTLRKMKESKQGVNSPLSKKVVCLENGIVYNGIREAGRMLDIDSSSITKVCKNKKENAKGYHFKYYNKEEG